MAFYLRNPQAELVRGKCPRGHGSEEQCPGFITSAEVVRPAKQPPTAPAPAPKPAARPGRSMSGGAAAAAPGAGKLSKSTKIMASHAKSAPSIERAPDAAPPPQPGILRDRLGRRLEPPGGGADAGDGAGPPAKKRPPLKFPGGIRPEELTLCRLWEARGECKVPNCVFAHCLVSVCVCGGGAARAESERVESERSRGFAWRVAAGALHCMQCGHSCLAARALLCRVLACEWMLQLRYQPTSSPQPLHCSRPCTSCAACRKLRASHLHAVPSLFPLCEQEELAEREDEFRAEQARLKREAKEARRL